MPQHITVLEYDRAWPLKYEKEKEKNNRYPEGELLWNLAYRKHRRARPFSQAHP